MSTFRRWAFWRRVQYGFGFSTFVGMILGLVYIAFFYSPASCFDNVMNGREIGVDCGGACVRICAASVVPPRIVWTESFEITEGQYNTVAYVENSNKIASTPQLHYTFELLDGDTVVAKREGTTILPPDSVYPIFEGRVFTEQGRKVTDTRLTLKAVDLWIPASVGREQFKTSNIILTGSDAQPRLDVRIENSEVVGAQEVEVVATLFNNAGEPVTSSQTFIDALDARSSKDIVFTWPNPIARTVRSCIIPTDVAMTIDLSGSMNNDGGNPPQPVTDALAAAKSFIESLNENDQSTVITFDSEATTEVVLGSDHMSTASQVNMLTISPEAETGFTNTTAALLLAQTELNSERHNKDARRVVVILTDGLPTGRGDADEIIATTKSTADTLASDDISVYAIGLGKGVDLEFIKELASDPLNAFYAPTTNDLEGIYQKITSSLCESGTARIDVIAKTKTNFAPLR